MADAATLPPLEAQFPGHDRLQLGHIVALHADALARGFFRPVEDQMPVVVGSPLVRGLVVVAFVLMGVSLNSPNSKALLDGLTDFAQILRRVALLDEQHTLADGCRLGLHPLAGAGLVPGHCVSSRLGDGGQFERRVERA